jgi:uncharacterized protein YtpQ (UPF0354 family)
MIIATFIACNDDPITQLQFSELVRDRVEEEYPGVVISHLDERGFDYSRGVGTRQKMNVAEEYRYYTRNPESLDELVDRLASLVESGDRLSSLGENQERILRALMPVLKPRSFMSEAEARAGGQPLLMGEHATGLLIFYVIDQPTSISYLTAGSLSGLGLTFRQATDLALTNLYRRTGPDRYVVEQTLDGPFVRGDSRDGYDAARLISPVLLETLSRLLDTSALDVAIPRRDLLLAVPAGEPNLQQRLRQLAGEEFNSGPHAITPDLFRVDRQGVRLLDSREENPGAE